MDTWLIVLIAILVILGIVAFAYMILAFRRISNVYKKLDYLVEDLTYKSEKMNNFVDAIVKISTYVDVIEAIVKRNSDSISSFIKNNAKNIKKFEKFLDNTSISEQSKDSNEN